ncbi:hypothetical protein BOX15_Mlig024987g1 [Macrostomum lignano]|uniref:J domain-containing protein n=1 Tax=Macrostomum lignano TaxID=282301 RepID=A0A267DEL5_9PLAT|nr:hypothetical protein BOX15_Mlig024987g3 [Macrostomum lignano]PAA47084.1 hypothetical protein BOX15_Mlig024987g2 [Macrostomum lignano]PAA51701.1 hypothetical protein BOX15_Mlig024987g1 [Macrostomum lignano]
MSSTTVENGLDIYKQAMAKAMEVPCRLPERDIEKVHKQILGELRDKFAFQTAEASELLTKAIDKNSKKKFTLISSGLRNTDCEVLEGGDNSDVLGKMRHWLCDFPELDRYWISGYFTEIGLQFDEEISDRLSMNSLLPKLIQTNDAVTVDCKASELNCLPSTVSLSVEPISAKLHLCSPESVSCEVVMELYKAKYSLNGTDRELKLPVFIAKGKLTATTMGTIEYSVAKEVKLKTWTKIVNLVFSGACDKRADATFTHKIKLRIQCDPGRVKSRDQALKDISLQEVEDFKKAYKNFTQAKSEKEGAQLAAKNIGYQSNAARNATRSLETDEPWAQFVKELRNGGVKAATEMLKKKPNCLESLKPNYYPNELLGITFEELQIAKVMAEVQRRGAPIVLHAGDGNGKITIKNHVELKTPEYTDAVFQNTHTGEYFAVQFKYTDTPENLVDTINNWRAKWNRNLSKREFGQAKGYPEALQLDNVTVIGPKGIADATEGAAESRIRIGFEIETDTVDNIRAFLDQNRETFRDFLQDKTMSSVFAEIKPKLAEIKKIDALQKEVDGLRKGIQEVAELEARIKSLQEHEAIVKHDGSARQVFVPDEGNIAEYQKMLDDKIYELIDKPTELRNAEERLEKLKNKREKLRTQDEYSAEHQKSVQDKELESTMNSLRDSDREKLSQCNKDISKLQSDIEKLKSNFTKQQRREAFEKGLSRHLQAKNNEFEKQKARRNQLEKEVANLENKAKSWLEARLRNPSVRTKSLDFAIKKIGLEAAIGAFVDAVLSGVISCDEEVRRYLAGEISSSECAIRIARSAGFGAVRGGVIRAVVTSPNVLGQICKSVGYTTIGKALTGFGRFLGPAMLVGTTTYSAYQILMAYRRSLLSKAERNKQLARLGGTVAATTGGTILALMVIGGPCVLLVEAGIVIFSVLADHYLGDKFWSMFFEEDQAESEALKMKQLAQLEEIVTEAAYQLLNVNKYCSDEELQEAYRAAQLKNHPDKGGDKDIFIAVQLAHEVIMQQRDRDS